MYMCVIDRYFIGTGGDPKSRQLYRLVKVVSICLHNSLLLVLYIQHFSDNYSNYSISVSKQFID